MAKDINPDVIIKKCGEQTIIDYKRIKVDGKATPKEVLESILNASQLQVTRYVERLSKGQALVSEEVKALKDIGELVLKIDQAVQRDNIVNATLMPIQTPGQQLPNVEQSAYSLLEELKAVRLTQTNT